MTAVEDATIAIRVDRLRRIIIQSGGEYDGYFSTILQEHGHRYLLVESSTITGDLEFSTHGSPASAFFYSANQECADDWDPERLIDLDTLFAMKLVRSYGVEVESVHKVLLLENT